MNHYVVNNPLSFLRSILPRQLCNGLLLSLIVTLVINTPAPSSATKMSENVSLTTVEIIKNNGYAVEVHEVVTEDGYILELHRIPRSKSGQEPTRNHPVFIHHGILGSSADWVLAGADMSLPMHLADAGYDVWLANCRGNTYSRKHVSISWKQKDFWNFSLNEIGTHDLPASFDYILAQTNVSQLHYIGYSMGSCVFFIMASERPEYQHKIRSQISLAPVAYLSNTRSSLRYIARYARIMNAIFQRMSSGMLMPQSRLQRFLATTICKERLMQRYVCEKCIIFSVCGSDPYHFDTTLIPLIMGHFPAGTSAKLASHFAQFILKESFGQFDYGPALNLRHYNSTEPPTYDLKSINVPITLIYGENDILADTEDVMRLKVQLPKLMDAFPVSDPYCNHVDFLWSTHVKQQVNDPVAKILEKTDDAHWQYSGPEQPVLGNEIGNEIGDGKRFYGTVDRLPSPHGLNFSSGLDYILDNLDAIIASTMPRAASERDAAEFDLERERQKVLFAGAIEAMKSAEKKYGRLRADVTNELVSWSDGVANGAEDARKAMEDRVKKTVVLINGKIAIAGKSVVDGIAKTENQIVSGVTRAEGFVTDGVVRAEQSVVGGISRAEGFVNRGLDTVFNSTLKSLNRAFWFLKR